MTTYAITGAFGYTGKYIAKKLLTQGHTVITLTGNPNRANPFGDQIQVQPFNFDDLNALAASLTGVEVFINTYWVRFDHGDKTFTKAVQNTKKLINAAKKAGVRRFIHVSISNPAVDSPLPYFSGKATLEQYLQDSGLSYAILRPTVIFGKEDILINNIAYLLRKFPFFAIPGDGKYRLQPIFVEEMADLAIQASQMDENFFWDAVGPETFSFQELVKLLRFTVGSRSILVNLPPGLALFLSRIIGFFVNDVILTSDEVKGLKTDLLISAHPPRGDKKLSEWLQENREIIGVQYASEIARHYE